MTLARQLAEVLTGIGIKRVYGLPGEDHMALLDAFVAAGLEYHTAYNETSAVLMAGTDSLLTGLPGVAVLSMAPGVSNAVNGILNAAMEQQPVLVISGRHPADRTPFIVRQGFETARLVEPVTKWRAQVTANMDIAALAGRAVDEAMSGRPGPVYLEIPDAAASAPPPSAADATTADATATTVARLRARWRPATGATPAAAAAPAAEAPTAPARDLAAKLARAERPVLIIGGHQHRVSAEAVQEFATAYRMPVLTTTRQWGLIPATHPYCAGTFLNGRLERELLDRSDLVLLIDPEAFDFYNRPWAFSATSIAIVAADYTDWLNPVSESHVADPEALLNALTAAAAGPASRWLPKEITAYRQGVRTRLLAESGAGMTVPQAVAAALDRWPARGYITADAGFSKPIVAMLSQPGAPDHFLASNGLSTMGFSIPAALAVRRSGAGPVLAFMGDGSLLMRATELAAAARAGTPLVAVAVIDRSLTQIAVKQERRRLVPVGAELPEISCAALAAALGIDGVDVDSPEKLSAAVDAGLQSKVPMLIGAIVDPAPSRPLFELMRG
jgi:acetolactate synthase-1/2/3 large subunit